MAPPVLLCGLVYVTRRKEVRHLISFWGSFRFKDFRPMERTLRNFLLFFSVSLYYTSVWYEINANSDAHRLVSYNIFYGEDTFILFFERRLWYLPDMLYCKVFNVLLRSILCALLVMIINWRLLNIKKNFNDEINFEVF